ncbi:MAG: VWA domain-containing protein [Actinomycetota bacterium]|nr:VWA domain-containing protein [Actinomycetota bacterium]
MSFASPLWLLALLLLPLAAAAYVVIDRRRRRAAEAFASPRLLDSVAPSRPGWRRHAPMALYGVALGALAVALARPEATVSVPDSRASVILTTDISGSMEARDVKPTRLAAARRAALDFMDQIPDELRVGAVTFNHRVRSIEAPNTDREPVLQTLRRLRSSGGTATGDAFSLSLDLLERARTRRGRKPAPAALVLLSDGASTHGQPPGPVAERAARTGIPVYTVALGTDAGSIEARARTGETVRRSVPPDRETMRQIADTTGGRYFGTADDLKLDEIYERLGKEIGRKDERREITWAFAGGAALLLLAGGAASLRWFGRLP